MKIGTRRTALLVLIGILSFLAFLDATYLTIEHYQNIIPPCTTLGCNKVLTSQYSTFGAMPISLLGSIYFLTLMILSVILLQTRNILIIKILILSSFFGMIVSLVLFLIQFLVIKSFCPYCLFSELLSLLIFFLTIFLYRSSKQIATETS